MKDGDIVNVPVFVVRLNEFKAAEEREELYYEGNCRMREELAGTDY